MSWINFYISFLILANNIVGDSLCKKYCNARFDFCVEYPASFVSMPPPANNDGLTFLSTDKKTKIPAFGSLAVEDFDRIDQEFTIAISNINLTYKKVSKDWFIFSGLSKQGEIVYRKTVRKKINYKGDQGVYVFQTLMIIYPAVQNNIYQTYCIKISKSLSVK
jgi:hypothetical protein